MASSAAEAKQRTADSSTWARSEGVGRAVDFERAGPILETWLDSEISSSARSALGRVPAAQRAAVTRAEGRPGVSGALTQPVLLLPGRSGVPGRGWGGWAWRGRSPGCAPRDM